MSRATARPVLLALVVALGLLTGCQTGTDDELAPRPTRTITATPSQSLAPAPATIPVGDGRVAPGDVVWAQGSVLHVGRRAVDLEPADIDAFVVVRGGVFVLSGGELWFTDLSRLRGTGQTQVTHVRLDRDAAHLVVTDTRSGHPVDQAYDTATGRAVREGVDTLRPAQWRDGPGRYRLTEAGPGQAFVVDRSTGEPARVQRPAAFTPGIWLGESTLLGVGEGGNGRRILRCQVRDVRCRTQPGTPVEGPVVFGTGR